MELVTAVIREDEDGRWRASLLAPRENDSVTIRRGPSIHEDAKSADKWVIETARGLDYSADEVDLVVFPHKAPVRQR